MGRDEPVIIKDFRTRFNRLYLVITAISSLFLGALRPPRGSADRFAIAVGGEESAIPTHNKEDFF